MINEFVGRTILLALCVTLLRGQIKGFWASAAVWFVLLVPEVIVVLMGKFWFLVMPRPEGPSPWVTAGIAVLTVLVLALPFAWLQRKWDLTAALAAHGWAMFVWPYGVDFWP